MNIKSFIEEFLPVYIKGLMMGVCDIIPGVSGGTVAFITGIYPRLISALAHIHPAVIRDLIRGNFPAVIKKLEEMDVVFLVLLAAGIGTAFILISRVMLYLLTGYPAGMNGFFLGLIVASSVLLYAPLRSRYPGGIIFLGVGILTGLGLVMLNPANLGHSLPVLFITGFFALCAMILPGISGAYITLLFNQYEFMLEAIKSLALPEICAYLAGGIIGLLTFTRLLKYLLKYYHDAILAFLTGLMLGSTKLLYDRGTITEPAGLNLVMGICAGLLVVVVFAYVKLNADKNKREFS